MTSAAGIKLRATGATAVMGPTGFPHVTSETGGTLQIVTGAAQPGFNPLDLLYASLSACLAMSARIAANRLGALDRLTGVTVKVTGDKAEDEPLRIARFHIRIDLEGDLDEATRQAIAHAAEDEICTVANTFRSAPDCVLTVS